MGTTKVYSCYVLIPSLIPELAYMYIKMALEQIIETFICNASNFRRHLEEQEESLKKLMENQQNQQMKELEQMFEKYEFQL